jgi:hypothetical protein
MDALDLFFKKFSYKFEKGYPDMNNKQDVLLLETILKELGINLKKIKHLIEQKLKKILKKALGDLIQI